MSLQNAPTKQIRAAYLSFFEKQGHRVMASSSLVPRNDPSLLFTNAGMNQFKRVFMGLEERPAPRAATAQKCLRAGGKHNDLENVGFTLRHHTFFEMLGNFSFGDYFKEEAVEFAWRFVTQELSLDPRRLIITTHSSDEDTRLLWKKIAALGEDRLIAIDSDDNFWTMGNTGPCGPCTEIFYDYGARYKGGPPGSAAADGDRFIEIWNIVFMQFNQKEDGTRAPLVQTGVDTGMGLERLAALMAGVPDNYGSDIFVRLIEETAAAAHQDPSGIHNTSFRVIADHIRACVFLLADGVSPSNEGRGYVLRRILRRALRHGRQCGLREPFLHALAPTVDALMGGAYPEIGARLPMIAETLLREEQRFLSVLDQGMALLEKETEALKAGESLTGEAAFTLYDTYGFPLDLTQDILKQKNITVDVPAFEEKMAAQKNLSKKAQKAVDQSAEEAFWVDLLYEKGPTEFMGYHADTAEGLILALGQESGQNRATRLQEGQKGEVLLNQTPFYAEMGGQVGDTGTIRTETGLFKVTDTQYRAGRLIVHRGLVTEGVVTEAQTATAALDIRRREQIRRHHSATHLLFAALKRILGDHVHQKGAFVADDSLRFDFSHNSPLSEQQKDAVEDAVNDIILQNQPVLTRLMSPEEAVREGATALFGEKYGAEARVISIGVEDGRPFSMELCGGTHVRAAGDIGMMLLTAESSIAAGVRRLEAVCGQAALRKAQDQRRLIRGLSEKLSGSPAALEGAVGNLMDKLAQQTRTIQKLQSRLALAVAPQKIALAAADLLSFRLEGLNPKDLRGFADQQRQKNPAAFLFFFCVLNDKVACLLSVPQTLSERFPAQEIIPALLAPLGGQGSGGKPTLAQAGGQNTQNYEETLTCLLKTIQSYS